MTDLNLEELLYQALRPMPCLCRRAHYNGPIVDKCRRCIAVDAYELKIARRSIVQTPKVAQQLAAGQRDPGQVGERHE